MSGEEERRTSVVAIATLVGALLVGIAADQLLRTPRMGINLWILSLAGQGVVLALYGRYQVRLPASSFTLLGLSGLLLLSFAWRDSAALNALALLASLALAGLAAWLAQRASLIASVSRYCAALFPSALGVMIGCLPLVFSDTDWSRIGPAAGSSVLARVGRGLVLALPPVVVFGALLGAADPILADFFGRLLAFDVEALVSHLALIGFVAWGTAGYLRQLIVSTGAGRQEIRGLAGGRWGHVEIMIVLGSVNLVFLIFVALQVRALFGGEAYVLSQTGLTYAEYARQGFFQMTWAVALVLPLLLFLEWIGRRQPGSEERHFRIITILLLALLLLVLFSAFHRMRVYQLNYGLTELRVYTTAFMVWLAPVLLWFGFTVLAGRRERFPAGAVALGLVAILALHAINPDELIARVNLERASQGHDLDAAHAVSLSADAAPVLIAALDQLPAPGQCAVIRRLDREPTDWRSWNLSRRRAIRLMGELPDLSRRRVACESTSK